MLEVICPRAPAGRTNASRRQGEFRKGLCLHNRVSDRLWGRPSSGAPLVADRPSWIMRIRQTIAFIVGDHRSEQIGMPVGIVVAEQGQGQSGEACS